MSLLNIPLTFQQLSLTDDGAGGTTGVWNTVKTVFGDVDIQQGQRIFVQGQERTTNTYDLRIRTESIGIGISPIENYRFILNAYKSNITLKILNGGQPDSKQYYSTFQCIADDGK